MNGPGVTVLMPVYNAGRFLRPAIDGILAQTFRDFEFVIVDDGSTDGSGEVIKSYRDPRIRLLEAPHNLGLAGALNAGLKAATGALVARQDADDVSEPQRLERQVAAFAQQPDLALLGSQGIVINEHGRRCGTIVRSLEPASIGWYALLDNPFTHTSVMFQRTIVEACGGYDERAGPYATDYVLWCRVLSRHAARNLADRLVRYRLHRGSIMDPITFGSTDSAVFAEYSEIIRRQVSVNLNAMFGESISDEHAALLARFVLGIPLAAAGTFVDVFSRLLGIYEAQHLEGATSADFRRTIARQVDAIAYRLTPPARAGALGVYVGAVSARPWLMSFLPWPRALATVALGRDVRARLGRACRLGTRPLVR